MMSEVVSGVCVSEMLLSSSRFKHFQFLLIFFQTLVRGLTELRSKVALGNCENSQRQIV